MSKDGAKKKGDGVDSIFTKSFSSLEDILSRRNSSAGSGDEVPDTSLKHKSNEQDLQDDLFIDTDSDEPAYNTIRILEQPVLAFSEIRSESFLPKQAVLVDTGIQIGCSSKDLRDSAEQACHQTTLETREVQTAPEQQVEMTHQECQTEKLFMFDSHLDLNGLSVDFVKGMHAGSHMQKILEDVKDNNRRSLLPYQPAPPPAPMLSSLNMSLSPQSLLYPPHTALYNLPVYPQSGNGFHPLDPSYEYFRNSNLSSQYDIPTVPENLYNLNTGLANMNPFVATTPTVPTPHPVVPTEPLGTTPIPTPAASTASAEPETIPTETPIVTADPEVISEVSAAPTATTAVLKTTASSDRLVTDTPTPGNKRRATRAGSPAPTASSSKKTRTSTSSDSNAVRSLNINMVNQEPARQKRTAATNISPVRSSTPPASAPSSAQCKTPIEVRRLQTNMENLQPATARRQKRSARDFQTPRRK